MYSDIGIRHLTHFLIIRIKQAHPLSNSHNDNLKSKNQTRKFMKSMLCYAVPLHILPPKTFTTFLLVLLTYFLYFCFATMYNYMLCSVMFMISFLKFNVGKLIWNHRINYKSEDHCHKRNFEQEDQFLFRDPERPNNDQCQTIRSMSIKFQKIILNQRINFKSEDQCHKTNFN